MRMCLAIIAAAVLLGVSSAGPAHAGTRSGQTQLYATRYATYQGWQLVSATRAGGNDRRARFVLRFLANPAPGTEHCYDDVVTVDSCPAKWYTDDFPFYMRVHAVVAKCGPGWFVVSTPLDRHRCRVTPPGW
jgi:hypothetical protein